MKLDQTRYDVWHKSHELYRQCYVKNRVPLVKPYALDLGHCMHAIIEADYGQQQPVFETTNQQAIDHAFRLWPAYQHHARQSDWFKVGAELEFEVPIPHGHSIVGRLDGVLCRGDEYALEEIKHCNDKHGYEVRKKWITNEWRTKIQAPVCVLGARSLRPEWANIRKVVVRVVMDGDPPQMVLWDGRAHEFELDDYRLDSTKLYMAQTCDEIEMYRQQWGDDCPWVHGHSPVYNACDHPGKCEYEAICGLLDKDIDPNELAKFGPREEHLEVMRHGE